jgi:hypothetical protein
MFVLHHKREERTGGGRACDFSLMKRRVASDKVAIKIKPPSPPNIIRQCPIFAPDVFPTPFRLTMATENTLLNDLVTLKNILRSLYLNCTQLGRSQLVSGSTNCIAGRKERSGLFYYVTPERMSTLRYRRSEAGQVPCADTLRPSTSYSGAPT